MDKMQAVVDQAPRYEAPKVVEIGQVGAALQGRRMGMILDGGIGMIGSYTLGLTTVG